MSATQGHDFRGYYLHEDGGFNNAPTDSTHKTLGADARITQAEGSNNAVQMFEPGSRVPQDIVERLFDGAFSVEFTYTNPWWLNFVYGAPSTTDNGDGSHTHTWNGETPQPQRIFIGREGPGDERALKGCLATNVSVAPSVGGMARVTIDGVYADEEYVTGSIQAQPSISEKPMTFADATLSFAGTTMGYVQQGQLGLQNNMELIHELGSRVAVDFADRTLVPSVNFTKIHEDSDTTHLEEMYGTTGSTTVQENISDTEAMTLTLDNGSAAGSGINKLVASLTGTFPNNYAESGLGNPEEDVTEEVNRLVETATFDATNETDTAK